MEHVLTEEARQRQYRPLEELRFDELDDFENVTR